MILQLPSPIRGNTHVRLQEVAYNAVTGEIRLSGQSGDMESVEEQRLVPPAEEGGEPTTVTETVNRFVTDRDFTRYVYPSQLEELEVFINTAESGVGLENLSSTEVWARKVARFLLSKEAPSTTAG